jgi:hypothetical protein
LIELMQKSFAARTAQFDSFSCDDVCLIFSFLPSFDRNKVIACFGSQGYGHFTMFEAEGAAALRRGQWVAHWTLLTDGTASPEAHLTFLPPIARQRAGRILMLWAQDLMSNEQWSALPELVESCYAAPSDPEIADETPTLMDWATQVAERPERWDEAVRAVCEPEYGEASGFHALFPRLLELTARGQTFSEPEGFIAAALTFELMRSQPQRYSSADRRQVGMWALKHPLAENRWGPIRAAVAEAMLADTETANDPKCV